MATQTVIQVKRTTVTGRAANTTTLTNPGELAVNLPDGILYSTNGSVVFEIGANLTSSRVNGPASANIVTLTWGANQAINFANGNLFQVTILNNTNFDNPTNVTAGAAGSIIVTQGNGGGWTVSYSSNWKFPDANPGVMASGSGDISRIDWFAANSTFLHSFVSMDIS